MNELAIGVLALVAIGFVAFPLVRPRRDDVEHSGVADDGAGGEGDPVLAELLNQRDATYRAIKEIEFDHAIGSLSEEDYRDLRERYKLKALGLLKAIKEREQQMRLGVAARDEPAASDAIERAVSRRRARKDASTCPRCGDATTPGARFCPSCGYELAPRCPACGAPHGPGDRFCAACGARLGLTGERAMAGK